MAGDKVLLENSPHCGIVANLLSSLPQKLGYIPLNYASSVAAVKRILRDD